MVANDLDASKVYYCIYDGTQFQVLHTDQDYQPLDTQLTDIAGLTPTDGNIIVGDGSNWVVESGATARTTLGCVIGTDVAALSSGVNSDITSLGGITDSTWTPTFSCSGSMTISGESILDAFYQRIGGLVFFTLAADFTLGGTPSTEVQATVPVGTAEDGATSALYLIKMNDGDGTREAGRWQIDGGKIVVTRNNGGNWSTGSSGQIDFQGFYEIA